jgi:hypothetical protein
VLKTEIHQKYGSTGNCQILVDNSRDFDYMAIAFFKTETLYARV